MPSPAADGARSRAAQLTRGLATRLPVPAALRVFRALSPLARVPPSVRRLGADGLGLEGSALARWERRAWWGSAASRTVKDRLARGRDRGMERLLLPVDWSPLETALAGGHGVVLAGAHVGPGGVACWAVARRHPDVLCLLSGEGDAHPTLRVRDVSRPDCCATALIAARLVLRRGGIVFVPADGRFGAVSVECPLLGRTVCISEGAPTLARLCGAPTVPICALWAGDRIRVELAPPLVPSAPDPVAWRREWLGAYLGWLEGHLRGPAENLQIDEGGLV